MYSNLINIVLISDVLHYQIYDFILAFFKNLILRSQIAVTESITKTYVVHRSVYEVLVMCFV